MWNTWERNGHINVFVYIEVPGASLPANRQSSIYARDHIKKYVTTTTRRYQNTLAHKQRGIALLVRARVGGGGGSWIGAAGRTNVLA